MNASFHGNHSGLRQPDVYHFEISLREREYVQYRQVPEKEVVPGTWYVPCCNQHYFIRIWELSWFYDWKPTVNNGEYPHLLCKKRSPSIAFLKTFLSEQKQTKPIGNAWRHRLTKCQISDSSQITVNLCRLKLSESSTMSMKPHSPSTSSPVRQHQNRTTKHRSLRESLTTALSSPVRIGRQVGNSINKAGESARNLITPREEPFTWRDQLEIPPDATKEEAMAYLLCKELGCLDMWLFSAWHFLSQEGKFMKGCKSNP